MLFEHLTQGSSFEAMLKFAQLEEITFSDNNITSLLQISKLEVRKSNAGVIKGFEAPPETQNPGDHQ